MVSEGRPLASEREQARQPRQRSWARASTVDPAVAGAAGAVPRSTAWCDRADRPLPRRDRPIHVDRRKTPSRCLRCLSCATIRGLRYDMLTDLTAVDMLRAADRTALRCRLPALFDCRIGVRLRLKSRRATTASRCHSLVADSGTARTGWSARLRHVRHRTSTVTRTCAASCCPTTGTKATRSARITAARSVEANPPQDWTISTERTGERT